MSARSAKLSDDVLILYNEPSLALDDPDYASEAGVLESVAALSEALVAAGHRVEAAGIVRLEELFVKLPLLGKQIVVNLFEGFGGVGRGEAAVAGMLELTGLAVTGSGGDCLGLVCDKARTKCLLTGAGLPTPEFCLVAASGPVPQEPLARLLALGPVIVKPAHEDASLGIGPESVVESPLPLAAQVELVRGRYGAVIVERFIAGREFNAALMALPDPQMLPLSEIEFDPHRSRLTHVVTYEAKWNSGSDADRATQPRCPADVSPALAEQIGQIALAAFRTCGCRDYARVDLRVDEAQRVFILEVNGNPDLSPQAGFARALRASGTTYAEFAQRLVEVAAARAPARGTSIGQPQSP